MDLGANTIHLYITDPNEVTDGQLLNRYEALLSDDERSRMSRFYRTGHRRRFLLTRALIRTMLSRHCDVDPGDWVFEFNAYEKPEIAFPVIRPAIRFNISHCKDLIICGLTRVHNIGVEVEDSQRTTNNSPGRLSSYFSGREIQDLLGLPEPLQKQRFFDYWTLKEAYIKARGKGLAIPLDSFSFLFDQDQLTGLEADPDSHSDPADWQFLRLAVNDRLRIAIAINSATPRFRLSSAKVVPLRSVTDIQLDPL
jgi:4'-phosphopantetheinyl transferase